MSRFSNNNIILNNKGAVAFVSTGNAVLDIFTFNSKKFPIDVNEFIEIAEQIQLAMNSDPEVYIKILKLQRLIEKGNGIKWFYYLCMLILKLNNHLIYEQVLPWSWEYPKDLLVLQRISNMYKPINSSENELLVAAKNLNIMKMINGKNIISDYPIQYELVLYTTLVLQLFKNLINPSSMDKVNPMFLKYMSYESGHWAFETHVIWSYLEQIVSDDTDFIDLVTSNQVLSTELGSELRNILKSGLDSKFFTNRSRRLIKKMFNHHVNLLDNLFEGYHRDGTGIGTHESQEQEINLICDQIKKSATIAYDRFEKTVKKYKKQSDNGENLNPKKNFILKGYLKYLEKLETGEAKVKTRGLDVTKLAYEFFCSGELSDTSLECKLNELVDGLRKYLIDSVGENDFKYFSSKFLLLLDISGSMAGTPIETGLLYMLLMTKIFSINSLYYFAERVYKVDLTQEDLNGPICNLVKKIYKRTLCSTMLQLAFDFFEREQIMEKYIIIITDGDCDPTNGTDNPFQKATNSSCNRYLHNNNFIVVNVKQIKMNFPYLNMDPKVCYVTGNNPKTLNGFIKAMIIAIAESRPITPELVLKCSLDLEELVNSFNLDSFVRVTLSPEEFGRLFKVFQKNLPKKNIMNHANHDQEYGLIDYDSDEGSESW